MGQDIKISKEDFEKMYKTIKNIIKELEYIKQNIEYTMHYITHPSLDNYWRIEQSAKHLIKSKIALDFVYNYVKHDIENRLKLLKMYNKNG
jgi:hypothetical protein